MNNYTIEKIRKDLQLPFKLYDINSIQSRLEELKSADNIINNFYVLDKAEKKKIRQKDYQENARFFAYIKFLKADGCKYGLVGGKTNYTYPDLDFSTDYGNSKTSFARKFLEENNLNWDDTIIIVEHISADNKDHDQEMALFIECFLQREFNLFNS